MTRAVLPNPSARAEWLLASLKDRPLSHWVRAPPLDGSTMTVRQTQGQTPPHHLMTTRTSPLPPVNNPHHCSTPTSSRACSSFGAACFLVYQCGLELETHFGDHGVCSGVITDFLALESVIYERRPCFSHLHQLHSWPTDKKGALVPCQPQ